LTVFDARGIACDIPSVIYQFIWEPAVWSKYYSEGHEILRYFQDTASKHGLNKYIHLKHRVDYAQWLEEEGKWRVTMTNLDTGETFHDEGEVLINATGFLKCVMAMKNLVFGLM
jgi:cation diffusion facilitator CzcD-associated flavoprotein CzcO